MSNPPPLLRLLLLIMLVCPPMVMANMGTPLMWATFGHLMLGNVIIGLMEGWMLMRWFGAARGKALGGLIVGNFLSALAGVISIRVWLFDRLPVDLNNGMTWFWMLVGLAYVLTLLLEWPFVFWALKETEFKRLSQSVKASLLIQTVSYLLLAGWYGLSSQMPIYSEVTVVAPAELNLPGNVQVHYISAEDGQVYRRMLAGGAEQKVSEEVSVDGRDKLSFRRNPENSACWDLVYRQLQPELERVIQSDLPQGKVPFLVEQTDGHFPREFEHGSAPKLGVGPYVWHVTTNVWAGAGLRVWNQSTRKSYRVGFETPLGQWPIYYAYHLSQGLVVFQLGRDQICVLDPANRRVALLWRGRGAVCTLTDE